MVKAWTRHRLTARSAAGRTRPRTIASRGGRGGPAGQARRPPPGAAPPPAWGRGGFGVSDIGPPYRRPAAAEQADRPARTDLFRGARGRRAPVTTDAGERSDRSPPAWQNFDSMVSGARAKRFAQRGGIPRTWRG